MKLTSKGRYAVMALVDLARFDSINPVSLRDISLRQGISLVYLEQLFLKLKKNKIVSSVRGKKGGYTLNKNASEINISEDETILTASLRNDIQHLHACGGLGMCSTCRVEVLSGEDNLHPKSESEQALSDKLELPSNIRLACQTKVKGNVKLKRLLLKQRLNLYRMTFFFRYSCRPLMYPFYLYKSTQLPFFLSLNYSLIL